jgi:hypothetical protein
MTEKTPGELDVYGSFTAHLERFHFRCSGIRSVESSFGTRIP